jgi:colanic acid/amylovoran biosynthesis glycosyltransferase
MMILCEYKVLLFTGSFPYSSAAEDTFIDPELPYLKSSFSSVIIIPKSLDGERKDLPSDIKIETSLGQLLKSRGVILYYIKSFFLCLTSPIFYVEIIKKKLNIQSIIRLIVFLGNVLRTKQWVIRYIENNHIDFSQTLFYTYWLTEISMGLSLAKIKYPEMKIVSRAHGVDIYEERSPFSYIPFRPEIFQHLNKIFIASRDGQHYLSYKYPQYKQIFDVAILGVKKSNCITKQSDDNIFRIVTCSYLLPIKRIDLLIYGLKKLGELKINQEFNWVHIGNGPLEIELKKLSEKKLPKNVKYRFLGYLSNIDVMNYYKNNPIDIFINISQSEGGNPVSIMEAQSCGIPAIATAVGGNKEIVNEKVGLLLSSDPTPTEIAHGIITLLENPELLKEKKINSKINYEERYNSSKNHPIFIHALMKILLS